MSGFLRSGDIGRSANEGGKPLTEIAVGDQINVNHITCEAGADRRSRLYIKHTEGNTFVAYCHNCGKGGLLKNGNQQHSLEELATWVKEKSVKFEETAYSPRNTYGQSMVGWERVTSNDYEDYVWTSPEMTAYLERYMKYGGYSLFVHNATSTIELKLHNMTDRIVGHSRRCFSRDYTGPKWVHTFYKDAPGRKVHYLNQSSRLVVITEDVLSANLAHQQCGTNSIALLRTGIKTDQLLEILVELGVYSGRTTHEFIAIIALDRDIPGYKGTIELQRQLSVLGIGCYDVWQDAIGDSQAKDFKDFTTRELILFKDLYKTRYDK